LQRIIGKPSIWRRRPKSSTPTRSSQVPPTAKCTRASTAPVLKASSKCLRRRTRQFKPQVTTSRSSPTGRMVMARTSSTRSTPSSRFTRYHSAATRATNRRTCRTRSRTCVARQCVYRAAANISQSDRTARRASILKQRTTRHIKTLDSTSPRRRCSRRTRTTRWRQKPRKATSQQQTRKS